jgi:auxin influx carrier (AUX1 LAX family)
MDSSEANGSLANEKAPETVGVGRYVEMEQDGDTSTVKSRLSGLLWHGGSAYDAWFSCASNQVTTLPSLLFLCSCSSEASESSYA